MNFLFNLLQPNGVVVFSPGKNGVLSTWNAKCPIFLGNFTPKTSNYCLKNRALGFPGSWWFFRIFFFFTPKLGVS